MSAIDPMTKMSRAILDVMEEYAPTLQELDTDVVFGFAQIVSAFGADFRTEYENRKTEDSA